MKGFCVVVTSVLLWASGEPIRGAVKETPIIVAFGDSTTARRGRIRIYSEILGEELPKRGAPVRVINAGVGGNHTIQARARFKRDVLDQSPDIVIIQFGINDAAVDVWRKPPATSPRVPLAAYGENLRFFVEQVREAGAEPILMTPNPMGWTDQLRRLYGKAPYRPDDPEGLNVILTQYAAMVRSVAKEEKVPLVDVFKEMEGRMDALLLDGMHPNDKGHRFVADLLMARLARVLR